MGATTGAATRPAVGAGAEENCVGAVLMMLMSEDSRVVIQDEAANREHNLQQNKLPYQLAGPPKLRWERFR